LTVCASRIAAVGSASRPAARRTLPRNASWIASVSPSFSHKDAEGNNLYIGVSDL